MRHQQRASASRHEPSICRRPAGWTAPVQHGPRRLLAVGHTARGCVLERVAGGRPLAEASRMTKLTLLAALVFSTLGACTIGDEGGGTGTGSADFTFCQPQQIDSNGDGTPDGLDINCDGVI